MKRNRPSLLICLDFDGTLAPIVKHPSRARMPAALRQELKRLAGCKEIRLAVISGRSLADVHARTGLKGIFYAGNHGLEIEGPGLKWKHPKVRAARGHLERVLKEAQEVFKNLPGVYLEDKGISASIHYRNVAASRLARFWKLWEIVEKKMNSRFLRVREGHKVVEVLPRLQWDKGRAARWLRKRLGVRQVVAIGDDRTDEDMFREANRSGWSFRVGFDRNTAATQFFRNQREVLGLLKLCGERP